MNPRAEDDSAARNLRTGTGMALIGIGILGIVWIVERIVTLGDGPQNIGFIASFASLDSGGARIIRTPNGDVEFPAGSYLMVGTFFYLVILAIVAGLAKALIGAGSRLLAHDVATLIQGLRSDVGGLKAYLETKAGELKNR